ncbi:hypothetical protein DPMN_126368 [Dreissena polymorpha]|uniref:Uncharacterized protein n=1 Tax=Dreissena polymorpha TaxID=45954 RepID=A0A9D4GZX2_DREPO|nr:hypothetical protein DPMN_126368 [Dreissena polymorpha]
MLQFIHHWVIVFFIGILTAVLAAAVHILVEKLAHAKFHLIQTCILTASQSSGLFFLFL